MELIVFNLSWMLYNISLALIAVIFGWLTYETKTVVLKALYAVIWISFLPNTIYILTDIIHLFNDSVLIDSSLQLLLFTEYGLLMIAGVVTFLFSMYPFEIMLKNSRVKIQIMEKDVFLFSMNLLVAFGMVLGRVQRLNSWDIIFNLPKVIWDVLNILVTPQLLLLFLFFALLCNLLYFPFRNVFAKYEKLFYAKKLLKQR